jgi:hypothetical protein
VGNIFPSVPNLGVFTQPGLKIASGKKFPSVGCGYTTDPQRIMASSANDAERTIGSKAGVKSKR